MPIDRSVLAARLEQTPGVPLHRQLEAALRGLIQSGQVRPGTSFPGELDLADQLGLSRHTIRHALGVLTAEGLLRRERGRGTTVLGPPQPPLIERSLRRFYAFAWEVRARGAEQRSYILERVPAVAGEEVAKCLDLSPDAELERIVRLRTADGDPLVLETSYFPRRLAERLDAATLERESVYDVLERRCQLRVLGAREAIRPTVLDGSVAPLLHVPQGSPAFRVERTTWSDAGPIEWQESVVRGDRYLYSVELPRQLVETQE
ncbi:MAG TPA: GntR family transcriptional regulator [Chloroflexota bacterium]|nr:GntR family transcriptional regulator [Chloroflexota bacterium]